MSKRKVKGQKDVKFNEDGRKEIGRCHAETRCMGGLYIGELACK